jgi:hypothetical protein
MRDAGRLEQTGQESLQLAGADGIDPALGGCACDLRLKLACVPAVQICG